MRLPFMYCRPKNLAASWIKVLDTAEGLINEEGGATYEAGDAIQVEGRSVVVLKEPLV